MFMANQEPPLQTRNVSLSPGAADALSREWPLTGMKQKELMSRLVEFFAFLDRPSQQLITGTLPPEYVDDAAGRLTDLAKQWIRDRQVEAGLPPHEAALERRRRADVESSGEPGA